jgi:hypothetical protein
MQHLDPKPIGEAAPGDVLLMRFTRHPQRLAIVGDRGERFSLIHAYADAGACVEHAAGTANVVHRTFDVAGRLWSTTRSGPKGAVLFDNGPRVLFANNLAVEER